MQMKESIDSKSASQQAQNYFEYLPDELYGEIFKYFEGRELSMAMLVSKSFYRNAMDPVMLGTKMREEFDTNFVQQVKDQLKEYLDLEIDLVTNNPLVLYQLLAIHQEKNTFEIALAITRTIMDLDIYRDPNFCVDLDRKYTFEEVARLDDSFGKDRKGSWTAAKKYALLRLVLQCPTLHHDDLAGVIKTCQKDLKAEQFKSIFEHCLKWYEGFFYGPHALTFTGWRSEYRFLQYLLDDLRFIPQSINWSASQFAGSTMHFSWAFFEKIPGLCNFNRLLALTFRDEIFKRENFSFFSNICEHLAQPGNTLLCIGIIYTTVFYEFLDALPNRREKSRRNPEVIPNLAKALKSEHCKITTLYFENCNLTENEQRALAEAVLYVKKQHKRFIQVGGVPEFDAVLSDVESNMEQDTVSIEPLKLI